MCCHATAQHNCGHMHQWLVRCFRAKRQNSTQCGLLVPSWEYSEQFPCPKCRERRTAHTMAVLRSKGNKVKNEPDTPPKLEEETSTQTLPFAIPRASPMVQQMQAQIISSNSNPHNSKTPTAITQIPQQRATLISAPNKVPLQPPQADLTAWIPPSRRFSQVPEPSSSPNLAPTTATEPTPTLSPDVFPLQASSPPADESEEMLHPFPLYTSSGAPGYETGYGPLLDPLLKGGGYGGYGGY
ncbi:hypothetical protein Q7P37_001141 [Cladosporium fusiforme]